MVGRNRRPLSQSHTVESGPASIHKSRKAGFGVTCLRDVNRCEVRPLDLITHRGFAVLVTDTHAAIHDGMQGFFLHQTRFLSRFRIKIGGEEPRFVSANKVDHHSLIAYYLVQTPAGISAGANRDRPDASSGEIVDKAIEVQLNAYVGGGLHCDVFVTNHALAPTEISLALDVAADFADLQEAIAGKRKQSAPVIREWAPDPKQVGGRLRFSYAHPRLTLNCALEVRGGDRWREDRDLLYCQIALERQTPRLLTLDLFPDMDGRVSMPFYGIDGVFDREARAARSRRDWAEDCAQITLSDASAQCALDQAVSDLASLQIGEGEDAEPLMLIAGMPSYSGLFGRDAYLTALQSAILNPATLRAALEVLTPFNATATDDFRDAEPGKALHQRQLGPLAKLDLSPFRAYYGDHSTPGLFLLAAAREFAQIGDARFLASLKDPLRRTLDWMDRNADELGFYPYQTRSRMGLKNQSWKDSGEAVLYADGTNVADPIAMADVQALYYAAQQAIGLAFVEIGDGSFGERLLSNARLLKERFNRAFWMPDERFFAMALDSNKRQVRSIASDPGACLAYGVIDDDKTEAVADRLLASDMFSGWGIRTLSSLHPAYNPFAYHLGTVWPSMNAVAAYGLKRYGFRDHFFRVAQGLFDATEVFDLNRLPEVFGGHARDARHPHPGLYPGACSPQAWSAGAIMLLVDCMLGLTPIASRNLVVIDPLLPPWLASLEIRNIRFGGNRIAFHLHRETSGAVDVELLETGGVSVTRLRDAPAGCDRLEAALRSAVEPGLTDILS